MRRDWLRRSPRKVWGGDRTWLLFPGPLADKGQCGYLFVAALKGAGHRTELCRVCGNIAGLDGLPLRCLHPSQAGGLLDGTAAGLTGLRDADAKKPAPSLAAGEREVVLNVKHHTHIHITPEKPPCQVNPDRVGLNYMMSMYSLGFDIKAPPDPPGRFVKNENLGPQANEIPNQAASWLPGDDYYTNFHEGDPFIKVPEGYARLPGAGYEALHPELKDVNPEDYPDIHKMAILADVAPYSREYHTYRQKIGKQAQGNTELEIEYEKILKRVKQTRESVIRMQDRHFTEPVDEISGTVEEASAGGITLKEYPGRLFQFSSARPRCPIQIAVIDSRSMLRSDIFPNAVPLPRILRFPDQCRPLLNRVEG